MGPVESLLLHIEAEDRVEQNSYHVRIFLEAAVIIGWDEKYYTGVHGNILLEFFTHPVTWNVKMAAIVNCMMPTSFCFVLFLRKLCIQFIYITFKSNYLIK